MRTLIRLPAAARNPVSLLGAAIVTAMAVLFLVLFLLDLLGYLANPYIGLLVFVAIPALFLLGLLLVPLGVWWDAHRRRRIPGEVADWPVIDLRNPRQRTVAAGVLGLTVATLVIVSMAAYGGVHYMESSEFCGQVCHTTMEPQYVAHQAGPHGRVACASCHIGPGAGALLESKLAASRRVTAIVHAAPFETFGFNGSVGIGRETRPDAAFGLQGNDLRTFTVGVDATPRDTLLVGATYGFENYRTLQRSRQANPGAPRSFPGSST